MQIQVHVHVVTSDHNEERVLKVLTLKLPNTTLPKCTKKGTVVRLGINRIQIKPKSWPY